jgi:hypothetical protein
MFRIRAQRVHTRTKNKLRLAYLHIGKLLWSLEYAKKGDVKIPPINGTV